MNTFDMHCDTIYRLHFENKSGKNTLAKNNLQIDIEKLKKAGALGQFFALFYDSSDKNELLLGETPYEAFMKLYNVYDNELNINSDTLGRVLTYEDIENNTKKGLISSVLTLEGGESVMGSIENLNHMYDLGLRGITLTWNNENEIGYPNKAVNQREFGLKAKGIEIVKEMDRLGMMVDVSHLSDGGFWDVLEHTTKPPIATHSNSRKICDHPRNLTDKMIKALANRGGVTGLNFCSAFLDKSGLCKIEDLVKHSLYIIDKGGEDFLALGSDYDGIGNELEIEDISKIHLLEDALRKGGLKSSQIEKLFYKNTLRILRDIL